MISTTQTLAQKMLTGRLAAPEALRIATLLAEQLRQTHDMGRAHGALTPSAIAYDGNAAWLIEAVPGVSPYTAPELLQGRPADERSDIFSFGAILYEMLTGRRAFDGDTPEMLAASLTMSVVVPSGSPAVDRLVNGCLAKSPDSRFQRFQKLMLELRMLNSSTRRGAPAAAPTPVFQPPTPIFQPQTPLFTPQTTNFPPQTPAFDPYSGGFSSPMQELEGRISARLQDQERAIASVAQVANELLQAFRQQQSPAPPPAPRPTPVAPRSYARTTFSAGAYDDSSGGRLDQAIDMISDKISRMDMVLSSAVDRLQKMEHTFDEFDGDCAALRDSVTRDVRNFERALKTQSAAIESARTAMGQTDDLVERVVEALDSLQSMFVTSAEEHSLAS